MVFEWRVEKHSNLWDNCSLAKPDSLLTSISSLAMTLTCTESVVSCVLRKDESLQLSNNTDYTLGINWDVNAPPISFKDVDAVDWRGDARRGSNASSSWMRCSGVRCISWLQIRVRLALDTFFHTFKWYWEREKDGVSMSQCKSSKALSVLFSSVNILFFPFHPSRFSSQWDTILGELIEAENLCK